ncbi:unnamed protein product [Symbiodinium natans]|uniref:Intraflagellar transport protein 122 homolog n=1 Tax=Symbiodinium natans TaxID=878477 RepID=A0A812I052_9DINO|nr:unnamed protein product [Symbiodinium natans]
MAMEARMEDSALLTKDPPLPKCPRKQAKKVIIALVGVVILAVVVVIKLCHQKGFALQTTLRDATDLVNSVAWSADGRLAVGSQDRHVYVYGQDFALQKMLRVAAVLDVYSVAWSADGRLAVGSDDHVYVYGQDVALEKTLRDAADSVYSGVQ